MSDYEVKKSEAEVKKSTAEFDRAMRHLEEAIEDSSDKVSTAVDTVQDTIQKPVRMMQNARERIKQTSMRGRDMATQYGRITRDQSQLYYQKAQASIGPFTRTMMTNARQRPQMVGAIAGAFVLGVGSLLYFSRRKKSVDSRRILSGGENIPIVRSEVREDRVTLSEIERKVA
ncbi:MAG: hypothetical protein ACJ763_10155 [Bdellovibrionia bacterium]